MTRSKTDALRELLVEGVDAGAYPAAAAWISCGERPAIVATTPGVCERALWDLASLTKPMVTVETAMRGVASGTVGLDDRVTGDITLVELLGHRSGMPAWIDLAGWLDEALPGWTPNTDLTRASVQQHLCRLASGADASAQRGQAVYSDLGFMLASHYLDARVARRSQSRRRTPRWPGRAARPTGQCPRRKGELVSRVNDTNAWVLGGGGHAGAFGTVRSVGEWARNLERGAATDAGTIDGGVIRDFWRADRWTDSATWVVGWDTPSPGTSSGGRKISPDAVGHLGFTGTSVWIDRPARLVMVLLTNRVALGASAQPLLRTFRPMFHDAARELV